MNINKIKKICIILFLVLLSIIPCFVLFTNKNFISTGHDNVFHFSQIQDLYNSIKTGNLFPRISQSLNHGIGIGTRLMYGTFSHYLVALLGLIVIPLGGDLMLSYKIVILLSYLISNIIMYRLVYYVSKDKSMALLGVAIYALFPYRFSDVYIRNAFAETIVISLMPIVFYGLIKWIKEDYSLSSYVLFTTGMVLIIHTHNISALLTFVFVIFILLVNYKKLFNCLKTDKRHLVSFLSCIGVCVFLSAPFLISILNQASLNSFRIFNPDIMGTTYSAIVKSYNKVLSYFVYTFNNNWRTYLLISLPCFIIPLILIYLFDKNKYRNRIFIISYSVLGLTASFLLNSLYVLIGFIIAFIFLFVAINENKVEETKIINKTFIIITIISLILLFVLPIWYIMPSIFKNIQFIWRMWGFVCVFASILLPILIQKLLKSKQSYFTYILSTCVGLLVITSYPVTINGTYFDDYNTINENIANNAYASGWQLEYFPNEFFDNEYKSDSKLFNDIKNNIYSENEVSYTPYVYSGNGIITNYKNKVIPNISFDIKTDEECVIQLPLIYYKGYKVTLITDSKEKIINNYSKDGLLTISVKEEGQIKVKFVGSKLYQVASYTKQLTLLILLLGSMYYIYQKNCKKDKKIIK